MGNNKSRAVSKTKIENELSYDIRKKIKNECVVGTTATNEITISGSTVSGVNIKMVNEVTSSCEMRAALNELLQTDSQIDVASAIAESQMSSGVFASNNSNTELYTLVATKVSVRSALAVVNQCMQTVDLKNILTITDSTIADSAFEMMNTSFNECLQESLLDLANANGFIAEAEAIVEKHQSATSSLFGGTLMKIIIGVILAVVVAFFAMRFICRSKARFLPPFMMVCRFMPFMK